VAGNFSAFWLGITIMGLMAAAYGVSLYGLSQERLMKARPSSRSAWSPSASWAWAR
jgi:hypothetical protein